MVRSKELLSKFDGEGQGLGRPLSMFRNGDGIEKIDEVRQVEKTLLSFWLQYDT